MSLYRSYQIIFFVIFFCNLPQNFIQTDGKDAGTGAFSSDIVDTEPLTRLYWVGSHQRLARNELVFLLHFTFPYASILFLPFMVTILE